MKKLSMYQKYALAAQKAKRIPGCIKTSAASRSKEAISLLCSCKTPPQWSSLGNLENFQLTENWQTLSEFNTGKKEDTRNYKPVSLTSVAVKVMEKIILGDMHIDFEDVALSMKHS
ncbi:hypothetical protein DUI87_07193 [Hirundo rustica rustica]|uniref:Uncharacterized protein n=1 Tax=Hirundo rustica rustica TaxID=333673 RepID=A0A3M0KUD9_HIRRU|nr:hypothetical protein DUI87_07193 [Hirundo rustica rustica]